MSELNKLLEEVRLRPTDKSRRALNPGTGVDPGSSPNVASALVGPAQTPTRCPPPQDWDALIQRVQAVARQSREAEAQAREQEARIEQVLVEVREDITAANERMRAIEAEARQMQTHAEARALAAEERARAAEARLQAAEERAQHAEQWLVRVQEAILSEFTDLTGQAAA